MCRSAALAIGLLLQALATTWAVNETTVMTTQASLTTSTSATRHIRSELLAMIEKVKQMPPGSANVENDYIQKQQHHLANWQELIEAYGNGSKSPFSQSSNSCKVDRTSHQIDCNIDQACRPECPSKINKTKYKVMSYTCEKCKIDKKTTQLWVSCCRKCLEICANGKHECDLRTVHKSDNVKQLLSLDYTYVACDPQCPKMAELATLNVTIKNEKSCEEGKCEYFEHCSAGFPLPPHSVNYSYVKWSCEDCTDPLLRATCCRDCTQQSLNTYISVYQKKFNSTFDNLTTAKYPTGVLYSCSGCQPLLLDEKRDANHFLVMPPLLEAPPPPSDSVWEGFGSCEKAHDLILKDRNTFRKTLLDWHSNWSETSRQYQNVFPKNDAEHRVCETENNSFVCTSKFRQSDACKILHHQSEYRTMIYDCAACQRNKLAPPSQVFADCCKTCLGLHTRQLGYSKIVCQGCEGKEYSSCELGKNVSITSSFDSSVRLEDFEGQAAPRPGRKGSQSWILTDAGKTEEGLQKVFITMAADRKQLKDNKGTLALIHDKGVWQAWTITPAENGAVIITSFFKKQLSTKDGTVSLHSSKGPPQGWNIEIAGRGACKQAIVAEFGTAAKPYNLTDGKQDCPTSYKYHDNCKQGHLDTNTSDWECWQRSCKEFTGLAKAVCCRECFAEALKLIPSEEMPGGPWVSAVVTGRFVACQGCLTPLPPPPQPACTTPSTTAIPTHNASCIVQGSKKPLQDENPGVWIMYEQLRNDNARQALIHETTKMKSSWKKWVDKLRKEGIIVGKAGDSRYCTMLDDGNINCSLHAQCAKKKKASCDFQNKLVVTVNCAQDCSAKHLLYECCKKCESLQSSSDDKLIHCEGCENQIDESGSAVDDCDFKCTSNDDEQVCQYQRQCSAPMTNTPVEGSLTYKEWDCTSCQHPADQLICCQECLQRMLDSSQSIKSKLGLAPFQQQLSQQAEQGFTSVGEDYFFCKGCQDFDRHRVVDSFQKGNSKLFASLDGDNVLKDQAASSLPVLLFAASLCVLVPATRMASSILPRRLVMAPRAEVSLDEVALLTE